jgi:hypothetical protein
MYVDDVIGVCFADDLEADLDTGAENMHEPTRTRNGSGRQDRVGRQARHDRVYDQPT